VRLRIPAERGRLLREIWGSPSARRRAKELAKAGGGGLGLGTLFQSCDACSSCDLGGVSGEAGAVVLGIALAALLFVLLYYVTKKIIEYVRRRQNRLRPHGALRRALPVLRRGPSGVVLEGRSSQAPASGASCLAWGIELRCARFLGGDVMLRDGRTEGFELRLDDGGLLHVPKGRVRLVGGFAPQRPEGERWQRYLGELDPSPSADEAFPPFPYDVVLEARLAGGQRVQIVSALERASADEAQAGGYRVAPKAVLEPSGIPILALRAGALEAGE
jgi:hypothetical protein